MINISNSKHLDIIVPSSNKALAQVLTNATTKELETLTQGKDLKSIMGDILKSSSSGSSSDKVLLNLVKNNPTLQNLGNVTTTIKDLLKAIQTPATDTKAGLELLKSTPSKTTEPLIKTTIEAKTALPIEKVLKELIVDIKNLKNSDLKPKLENSGVFLESKLKDVKNPQIELKNTLQTLLKNIQTSPQTVTKSIAKEVTQLLNSDVLKSASQNAILKEGVKAEITKPIIQLSSNIDTLVSKIKIAIKTADSIHSPALEKALEKLEVQLQPKQLTPENFKLSSIQESLTQVSTQVNKSLTMESKGILNALEKIFGALKSVESSPTTPKASIEQLLDKKVPQEVAKVTQTIQSVIQKADPIFSKETSLLLNKLETLNAPQKLMPQANVKEILTNDLKALLLQTSDEVTKSSLPNQNDVLKQIDKLSLQIDNYQLISHLSNSSCLYLPFSWDMLEEGDIEFKKAKDDKFYCDIDLKLKEYGALNIKLTLYEENQLNLHIYSEHEKFKELIREEIPSLRSALIDMQITPREIRLFSQKKQTPPSPYETQNDNLKMGFEVKA